MRGGRLVAFVGPSLPAAEARRAAPGCTLLPPARQGDVWRALALRPAAIALVDGVFESVPSVWHHELLDALDAGVAVFGGASMGALRAAELGVHGLVGVGRIFAWYRDGVARGDDEVALLHAGPEHGWRPLTLPLVNVRAAAEALAAEGALSAGEARALVRAAAGVFYQARTWPAVLAAAAPRLRPAAAAALRGLVRRGPPDPKAEDARATLAAAHAFVRAGAPPLARAPGPLRRPSSLVRRRKLLEGAAPSAGGMVPAAAVLAALRRRPDAAALRDDGLRRALLAGLARALGIAPGAADRARAARRLPRGAGLDGADAGRLADDLAAEALLLAAAERAVPDGPSADEGLALGARLSGAWAEEARRLAPLGPREQGGGPQRSWGEGRSPSLAGSAPRGRASGRGAPRAPRSRGGAPTALPAGRGRSPRGKQ